MKIIFITIITPQIAVWNPLFDSEAERMLEVGKVVGVPFVNNNNNFIKAQAWKWGSRGISWGICRRGEKIKKKKPLYMTVGLMSWASHLGQLSPIHQIL